MTETRLPTIRFRARGDVRPDGEYVLYWMVAARRTRWNFALERAVELAADLDRPLVVLEPLRCGYRWASDRFHRFVLQGMADNRAALAERGVTYHPYVEPEAGAGKGLVAALAERACAVITDDYPCFFLPRMLRSAVKALPGRLEAVDGNGLLPMRAADRVFPTAHSLRRFLQKELPAHLPHVPAADPLDGVTLPGPDELPAEVLERWPAADDALLAATPEALAALPIDHSVGAAPDDGGQEAGHRQLVQFLEQRLARYGERNQPEADSASGLSPWLHFGHVSVHEVLDGVASRESWTPDRVTAGGQGARAGWWHMSEEAEGFLDELVTWRELGFNMCSRNPDYDKYESLPDWARATLEEHAGDPRDPCYDLETFENAATHDELWNAAQNQLRGEGRIHNYLRMLWAKKVLHWSASPQEALAILVELNNKYALDGRDPNSYSGIFWCFGRYDRAWGPERPIFGKVRYMTSENTARKIRVKDYVARWNEPSLFAS